MNELIDYRKIASEYFQKELLPGEVVHHIDGNHDNNDPENLVIIKKSQHSRVHVLFNFENWKKQHTNTLCVDCLFCKVYEFNNKSFLPLLYELLEIKSKRILKNEHVVNVVYNIVKKWKNETKHNCYTKTNMEAIEQ